MDIKKKLAITAPLDAVWAQLQEHAATAACIPGVLLGSATDDGYNATIRVMFGPKEVTFAGLATYNFDEATHSCTIGARGADNRNTSRAVARVLMSVDHAPQAPGESIMDIDAQVTFTGPLEGFIETGGARIADRILNEFGENFIALLTLPSDSPGVQEARPAKELNGLALIGMSLLSIVDALRAKVGRALLGVRKRFRRVS